jgi:hypothetical protein
VRLNHYIAIPALVHALSFSIVDSSAVAAQAKGGSGHRGGQADTHMSSKGKANTNAQWSADPDRGWLRAEERHELNEKGQGNGKSKNVGGKHKGKNSKDGKK